MAEKEGIITSGDVKNLYKTAKNIYYPQRTYDRVLKDSELDETKKEKLKSYLEIKGTDIKADDAKKVLEYIKELI